MTAGQVQGATTGATGEAAGKTLATGGTHTYGEQAVGLTFNPSGDPKVTQLKQLYAQIIDICNDERTAGAKGEKARLWSIAITEAQGAQMWGVKAATWKD
jgi:hypothetical protein